MSSKKLINIFLTVAVFLSLNSWLFLGWPNKFDVVYEAEAIDSGFYNPSANAAVTASAGDNNGYQTTPANAYVDGGGVAIDTDSGANTNDTCASTGADKHVYYNYGISLPAEATINGIEIRQDLAVDALTDNPFSCVQLSWNGGTSWTTTQSLSLNATAETIYTYGGSTSLWGRTWLLSELTNANFRVRIINGDTRNNRSRRDFSLDWVPVKIYYSIPDLQQTHYRWRNDDGNETSATWAANEDEKYLSMATGTIKRLRMEVSNEGLGNSSAFNYRLEVSDPNPSTCASASYARVTSSSDWQIADTTYYTNGTASTNVSGGLTDENISFKAGQLLDTNDQVSAGISLSTAEFTEIEFALQAMSSATTGPSYCFRLTNAGNTDYISYTQYAEASLAPFPLEPIINQAHYRWRDDDGGENSGSSWYNTSWGYRKKITIDSGKISGSSALVDFPVLISLADDNLKYTANGGHVGTSTGFDLVFTKADGATKIDHEIEKYDPSSGELIAWVKVDSLSPFSNTELYMYYGNSSSSDQQNKENVWDSDYVMVQHLHETQNISGNDHFDSTSNNNDGAVTGASMDTTGIIDGADSFNGGTDNVAIANNSSLNITGDITYSFWLNMNDYSTTPDLLTKGDYTSAYSIWARNDGTIRVAFDNNALTTTGTLNTGEWYYVAVSRNNNTNGRKIFINGDESISDTYTAAIGTNTGDLFISSVAYSLDGVIDEVRLSNIARSSDWIKTEYNNQSNPATFYSVSEEATQTSGATFLVDEDVKLLNIPINSTRRLRFAISNNGLATASDINFRLEVSGSNPASCAVATYTRIDSSSDWDMVASSYFADGDSTVNINPGLSDGNTSFVAGELKESNDQTSDISLTSSEFTELEYSLKATSNAAPGATYCFRLVNEGLTDYFYYNVYAEAMIKSASNGYMSVVAPNSVDFGTVPFSFLGQDIIDKSLGDISIHDSRIGSPGWSLDVSGADWISATSSMDYDGDGANTGQLTIDMSSATTTANSGNLSGLSLGVTDSFSAATSTINILTAISGNGSGDYDISNIKLDQFIPAQQAVGSYTTTLVFTAS